MEQKILYVLFSFLLFPINFPSQNGGTFEPKPVSRINFNFFYRTTYQITASFFFQLLMNLTRKEKIVQLLPLGWTTRQLQKTKVQTKVNKANQCQVEFGGFSIKFSNLSLRFLVGRVSQGSQILKFA